MLLLFIIFLAIILGILFVVCLQGLVYWMLGSFICWAFAIPYAFQFRHGLAIACLVSAIIGFVQKCKGGEKD